jgi:hypothetical protein
VKLPILCLTCSLQENPSEQPIIKEVEVRDDGRYETICPNGHEFIIILQQLKFEVLFEIGAYAINDGYYREAVSSFTSSLERFYEFVIRLIWHAKGLTPGTTNAVWDSIKKQSERQLGTFVGLYSSEFLKPPKLLTNIQIQFRNDVIHGGKIPTRSEAVKFGQAVLNLVRPIFREVKEKYPDGVRKIVNDYITKCRDSGGDPNQKVSTMFVNTIISIGNADPEHDRRPLEKALAELKKWA